MNAQVPTVKAGWSATLELGYERRGDRTALVRKRHNGPLRVQRSFYPETNGQCHTYILHPPGGIVAGDELSISAQVAEGAHALITTPSAGRVYKSNHQRLSQLQTVQLEVADHGWCEWLPQENIVFNDAQAINRTQVKLSSEASFTGWEITCLGRPASNALFQEGELRQNFDIYRNGIPLLLERNYFQGGSAGLSSPWGLQGALSFGTLIATTDNQDLLQSLQALCSDFNGEKQSMEIAAVTQLPELMVMRVFAQQAAPIKALFIAAWQRIRKNRIPAVPVAPRIWYT